MSTDNYSLDGLLEFLRQAPIEGLLNPAVAKSRSHALEQVHGELTTEEKADVRLIDVDAVCRRLHKLDDSSIRPEVVDLYNKRLKATLTDYLAWRGDARSFASVGGDPLKRHRRKERGETEVSAETRAREETALATSEWAPDLLAIPLRPGLSVFVQNLPLDLNQDEARTIAKVIEAMARPAAGAP